MTDYIFIDVLKQNDVIFLFTIYDIFVHNMFHLPQMTLGVVNKAELQVQGLVTDTEHKPVAPSLNTTAVDLRTVLRARFGNMLF